MTTKTWMFLWSLLICIISSCGYNFVGMGSALPTDIKELDIPLFANKTSHTGIENTITNALIREFNRSKRLRVVHAELADAVILGVVKAISASPLTYSETKVVIENRLTLYMDVTMKRNDNGKILWRDPNISHYQDYSVVSDITQSERNKEEAIVKVVEILSQKIHNRIFENF